MSNQEEQTKQLIEVVGAIKELTNEIKHLVKSHDETKTDVHEQDQRMRVIESSYSKKDEIDKHDIRLRDIEVKVPLFEEMRENQKAIKQALYASIFTGAVTFLAAILLFFIGVK